jgi:hypothetical protein
VMYIAHDVLNVYPSSIAVFSSDMYAFSIRCHVLIIADSCMNDNLLEMSSSA